jgi:hypothetical protein
VAFLVYSWIHPYIADLLPEQLISDFKIHWNIWSTRLLTGTF